MGSHLLQPLLRLCLLFSLPEIFTCPGTQQKSTSNFLDLAWPIIFLMFNMMGGVVVFDFMANRGL